MKIAKTLLAATSAGLLAAAFLWSPQENTLPNTPALEISSATAKVLKQCNMDLPSIQTPFVAASLNEWSPMWLVAQDKMSMDEQNEFCTQLVSTSIQGPSNENDQDTTTFSSAMTDTTQLMLEQIAGEVLKDDAVAEEIAPLMGLAPSDVKHYFKSVTKGSPADGSGPTPESGPHFNV